MVQVPCRYWETPAIPPWSRLFRTCLKQLARPDAILVVSAHYETETTTISGTAVPDMIFDYYGFPDPAYQLRYAAPGAPDLASEIAAKLNAKNIDCAVDNERGLDHGTFVPLLLMYPDADIPVMQLSIANDLDPQKHIAIGQALSTLSKKNILVLGSGMSFHNMKAYRDITPDNKNAGLLFNSWLTETLTSPAFEADNRFKRLTEWQNAPESRFAHPREEHLLPLHVCAGLGFELDRKATLFFEDDLLGYRTLGALWT